MKKIALIECYPYHTELLYSQVLFLKSSGFDFSLVSDIRNKEKLKDFDVDLILFDFKKLKSLWLFRKYILKSHFSHLIFNTAQGNIILKLMLLPFPSKIKFLGTLHNVNKIRTSFGQKIISKKIKNYFVLADYMKNNFPKEKKLKCEQVNFAYFYEDKQIEIDKEKDSVWIAIPGSIEYKRREYEFLIDLTLKDNFPKNVKFVLLGDATKCQGPMFIDKIKEKGVEDHFIWFENFIPENVFNFYMEKVDFLLPLIHPTTLCASDYLQYKISGTFLQAKAHSKYLLCHEIFNRKDFNFPSLFYETPEDLIKLLDKPICDIINNKLSFREDCDRYLGFIATI